MLVSDVIDEVRVTLQDTNATYRWTDAILIDLLNRGIRDVRQRRPDSQLDSNAELIDWTAVTLLTDSLILDDKYLTALVNYVCFAALSIDSDDTENLARANNFFQLYRNELAGV